MELQSFIGGCFGGFAGILVSYPFDTIKVRIQNQSISSLCYNGAIDCLRKTVAKESVIYYLFKNINVK
jgi:solute carrier family 25 carnitine/acylcarnitine transporter 20/29